MDPLSLPGLRSDSHFFGRIRPAYLLTLIFLILAGCSQPIQDPDPTLPPTAVETRASPASPTAAPTRTVTAAPPRVVLLALPEADMDLALRTQAALEALASGSGWDLETRASLAAEDLGAEVHLVVAVPPDPGVAALANAAPDRQFVAIGITGLTASDNLSLIGPLGLRPDQQGFLAGYLAAVITEEWRVGVLGLAEGPPARSAQLGFRNGVIYFCGLCRPVYPPFESYPAIAQVQGGGSPAEWQTAADQLLSQAVETVYLAPGSQRDDLVAYLDQSGMRVIGSGRPTDNRLNGWVAAVLPDPSPSLAELWPSLQAGQGGRSLPLAWTLSDVNPDQVSPGRAQLVEALGADLSSDLVGTGVDPLSGEPR